MGHSRYDIFSYNPKIYDELEIDKFNIHLELARNEEEKESSEEKKSDIPS